MEEIIIQKNGDKILVCILENGEIVEKYDFDENVFSTIGNIYVGTVKDIFDGMQAAFVELGLSKKGFLSLKDAMPKVDLVKKEEGINEQVNKLSDILKKEQKILVQIRKEAFEDKGPRVSTHITLAGNYLVLMPGTDIVTISQKIDSMEEKNRLMQIVRENLPKNFGCIVRTDAINAKDEELILDMENILSLWQKIQEKFEKTSQLKNEKDSLIYNDNNITMKIVRDMVKKSTKKIYVNDEKIKKQLLELTSAEIKEILEFVPKKNFIESFGLQTEFEKIDNRKVWLKCGAHIVIDKTEALTAIDVNSSRCIGNEDLEKTIFKVNKEAAIEIMKQIRLKDIGGIIVIDFIDMKSEEYKDEILKIMREEQKKDRSKIEIKDFTALNLVEMTRKKLYV